ncbi:phytanoyl-CoA dioxygenase family protein [Burkholderia stagnalis]
MTDSLEATFAADGFAVVPALFDRAELAYLGQLVNDVVDRHRQRDEKVLADAVSVRQACGAAPQRDLGGAPDRWATEPYIIGNLIAHEPRFALLLARPALWHTASRFLQCDRSDVVFHFSNITRKPSMADTAINWHRDAGNRYFSTEDDRTLRVLIPLQPMSADNGGTRIVPGSHVCERLATDAAVCPAVPAGAGLVLHSTVLHGGERNRSRRDRDVLIVQFGHGRSALRVRADEMLALAAHADFAAFAARRLSIATPD